MMEIKHVLDKSGWIAAPKRALNQATQDALSHIAFYWHGEILPKHFEPSAERKYGYQPRTAAYARRKTSYKHHRKPLYYSGALFREATSRVQVRSNSKNATAYFWGHAFNFSNRKTPSGRTYPDLRKESSAIDDSDHAIINEQAAEAATESFAKSDEKKTVVIQ